MSGSIFAELKRRRVIRVAGIYIVASWIMAQVADVMLPALQLPEWTLTLVVALLVLGFPIAMVLAWAFDVGPGGVVRTEEVHAAGSGRQTRAMMAFGVLLAAGTAIIFFLLFPGQTLALNVLIAAGILLVAATALWFFLLYPRRAKTPAGPAASGDSGLAATQPDQSIAVLPFLNLSGDADNEYFGDGIAEELINVLGRVDGLKVAARTSSRYFKGRNEKIQTIAEELGVATVLEGSVRRAGRQARISATLVNAADGYHLWSESYDRQLEDILAVQDEIARSIARALRVRLHGEVEVGATPTSHAEAYRHYLRASYLWKRREPQAIREAISGFEEAVRLDERFARAHANLGAAYHKLPLYDPGADVAEARKRAERAAKRALEIDPQSGEANATLASILAEQRDFDAAEGLFRRAIDVDEKDPTSHHWYANFLLTTGRTARALSAARRAHELDPLNAAIEGTLGSACFAAGRNDEALEHLGNAERLGWGNTAQALCGAVYLHTGDRTSAERCLRAGWLSGEAVPAGIVQSLCAGGEAAAAIRHSLQAGEIGPATAFRLSALNGALSIFELGVDLAALPAEALMSLWWPTAAPIRRDPQFAVLTERLGLRGLWRSRGWPDACHAGEDGTLVCT